MVCDQGKYLPQVAFSELLTLSLLELFLAARDPVCFFHSPFYTSPPHF